MSHSSTEEIVKSLRQCAVDRENVYGDLMEEAADMIEKLDAENAEWSCSSKEDRG